MTAVKELFKEFREINKKSVYDNQAQIEFPEGRLLFAKSDTDHFVQEKKIH